MKLLDLLASRTFALWLLAFLAAGLFLKPFLGISASTGLVVDVLLVAAYGMIMLSLVVCTVSNYQRMAQTSVTLLIFHISLILLGIFVLLSTLTQITGSLQVVEGETMPVADIVISQQGRLASSNVFDDLNLENTFFTANFRKADEVGHVSLKANLYVDNELRTKADINHVRPLRYQGTSFFISQNKGYAVILDLAEPEKGEQGGVVRLPTYPQARDRQLASFKLPGRPETLQLELDLGEKIYDATSAWDLRIPTDPVIKLTYAGANGLQTITLRRGKSAPYGNSVVTFEELRRWGGVAVNYDPWKRWVIYSAWLMVLSSGYHYLRRVAGPKPQSSNEGEREEQWTS